MPAKVILEVTAGPIQGTIFAFESHDTFLFGRHVTCHAKLPKDPLVSRHHFLLEVNPPDVRLRDLGSLNGTIVNDVKHGGRQPDETPEQVAGRRHPEVDLSHGDRITVGGTTIQVTVELPLACCQCSAEISEDDRELAEWTPGSFMCRECRSGLATAVPPPRNAALPPPLPNRIAKAGDEFPSTAAYVPRCERCGRDVSGELRNGRRGQYVCQTCRGAVASEKDGLRQLMQQAAERLRGPAAPEIDGYEIGGELGKGGMGVVYQATRKSDGQTVAIKMMLAQVAVEPSAREMFQREIHVTHSLRHPQIVSVFENGSAGSVFYFVMEYCNRGSLDRLINRQGGKLSLRMALPLMLQCLAGLEHAHREQFVHRDLKPHNILLDERDGRWAAKITDFGLAKSFEYAGLSGMTATGTFGGTFHFMPREQITEFKYVRPVSDVWSIAATFYNALTGRFPLEFPRDRDPMEVILRDDPVPLGARDPGIPAAVAAVIDRALSTDTGKRYQTAAEMRVALESAGGAGL